MADALRPLTLLLGAVCLWAFLVLLLALTGLGGNFPASGSVTAPPAVPTISLTRSQSRLGPIEQYSEVGERPLMTADRRPAPMLAGSGANDTADVDVTLTGVLIASGLQLAILADNKSDMIHRVRMGQAVPGSNWRLVQLEPRRAVLEGPAGQRVLELRVFDGRGGEAPTPTVASMDSNESGDSEQDDQSPAGPSAPPVPPARPLGAAPQARDAATAQPAPVSQEQQIESIRRRIEARRAQMRAEAAAASANEKQ